MFCNRIDIVIMHLWSSLYEHTRNVMMIMMIMGAQCGVTTFDWQWPSDDRSLPR